MIGAKRRGTIGIVRVRRPAAQRPGVVRGELTRPPNLPVLKVQRDNGVGHLLRRVGVTIAGRDVHRATTRIDGGRGPDSATGGSPLPFARLVRRAQLSLADHVRLPRHGTGVGVECRDAAAEGAAFVLGAATLYFLVEALHRYEDSTGMIGEPASDRGVRMGVDLADPDRLAPVRVHGVRVGPQVTKEHRPSHAARW